MTEDFRDVVIELTGPQSEFVNSAAPLPAIVGGLGSGKTRAGTMRAVKLLIENPHTNIGYYMPTYDLIKLRAIGGVEEDLTSLGIEYTTNLSNYSIDAHGFGSIILRSYDRPERIIAYETAHAIVDELDTISKEKAAFVWRKISERNRQKISTENSIGAVTTPDQGKKGFIYDRWVTRANSRTHLIKAPTSSNQKNLPADYIDSILENYDPDMAKLYVGGEFISLFVGKIYTCYDEDLCDTDREIEDGDSLHVSIDFNVGGCCATVSVIDNGEIHAVDEFVSYDTRDFCINLHARYGDTSVIVYPDASGKSRKTNASASDIDLIEAAGYYVDAPESNPFIRDRINAVNSGFAHKKLRVSKRRCPMLSKALQEHGYSKNGEPEKSSDHPSADDWTDSLGYKVHRIAPIIRPRAAATMRYAR